MSFISEQPVFSHMKSLYAEILMQTVVLLNIFVKKLYIYIYIYIYVFMFIHMKSSFAKTDNCF